MPFFSILMPTRNRGYLLRDSIQTVLGQDFDDYELIICDNNSHDDTRQVADEALAKSNRVRYINPGKDLSMCANWEYVLDHAVGDYILYVSDDDALVSGALKFVYDILTRHKAPGGNAIDVLTWQRGGYGHPDLSTAKHRTRLFLAFRLRSGNLYNVSSQLMINNLCDFESQHPNYHFVIPKMLNCAVSRNAILECKTHTGQFFVPPYPDYTSVCQLLATHDTYQVIDTPLYVCGISIAANSGIFYKRMEKVKSYFALFKPGEISFDGVPYPMEFLTATYLMMTYLKFQKLYPDSFKSTLNIDNYLASLATELSGYQQIGDDVAHEMEKLSNYMREHYGNDDLLHQHDANAISGRIKATAMFHLRQFAAKNNLTRGLASKLMQVAGIGAPDARQYSNVESIIEASKIIGRDLKLDQRQVAQLEPISIQAPEQLPLLA